MSDLLVVGYMRRKFMQYTPQIIIVIITGFVNHKGKNILPGRIFCLKNDKKVWLNIDDITNVYSIDKVLFGVTFTNELYVYGECSFGEFGCGSESDNALHGMRKHKYLDKNIDFVSSTLKVV